VKLARNRQPIPRPQRFPRPVPLSPSRPCPQCGTSFTAVVAMQKYCSRSCQEATRRLAEQRAAHAQAAAARAATELEQLRPIMERLDAKLPPFQEGKFGTIRRRNCKECKGRFDGPGSQAWCSRVCQLTSLARAEWDRQVRTTLAGVAPGRVGKPKRRPKRRTRSRSVRTVRGGAFESNRRRH
jgi:hypothetical protein